MATFVLNLFRYIKAGNAYNAISSKRINLNGKHLSCDKCLGDHRDGMQCFKILDTVSINTHVFIYGGGKEKAWTLQKAILTQY